MILMGKTHDRNVHRSKIINRARPVNLNKKVAFGHFTSNNFSFTSSIFGEITIFVHEHDFGPNGIGRIGSGIGKIIHCTKIKVLAHSHLVLVSDLGATLDRYHKPILKRVHNTLANLDMCLF